MSKSLIDALVEGKKIGEYRKCPVCGEADFMGVHQCNPQWFVRMAGQDRSKEKTVFAENPLKAAENAAKEFYEDGEFPGGAYIVINAATHEEYSCDVKVTMMPKFHAATKFNGVE